MPSNEPVTIWAGTGGQELTPSNNANIDTEDSKDIITESGLTLIIEPTTSTPKPTTLWTSNDSQ